jgi:LysM repeat protein
MSQIINEELSRMFYLLDHKRGVVISEQDATIASPAAATTTTTAPDASTTTGTPQEYVVQKGDTLGKIGQKFGVQWKEIATLNQIKNVNLIRVGQKLKIPGKTQTNATTVQTDIVSAAGTDVENLITQLFAKMPSFKTFGKYKDAGGMLKGIASNLTVDEIKQKNPTTLINLPITGFKFYPATEGRPFTKETYNVLTADGRVYVQYLNDVKIEAPNPEEVPKEDVTDIKVKEDIKVSNQTKRADRKICRIVRKGIQNKTDMSSMLGDVCQVLELCKTGGFIDKSVTLEACKKVDTTGEEVTNPNGQEVETKGKIIQTVDTPVETSTGL